MESARTLVPVLLVAALLGAACKSKPAPSSAPEPAATISKGTLGPDVKTVMDFMNDPALGKGALAGRRVRIHGYVLPLSPTKIAITAEADKSMPFVACLAKTPPALAARAHVVADGTVDPTGQLMDCTLSSL